MGMINAILMLWIFEQLNAPMWCYALVLMAMAIRFISWLADR